MKLIIKDLNVADDNKNDYVEGFASSAVKVLYDEVITEALKEVART